MGATAASEVAPDAIGATRDTVLNDRYRVSLTAPLRAFDTSLARGFEAESLIDAQSKLVALVADPDTPLRDDAAASLRDLEHPHLMRLVDAGPGSLAGSGAPYPVVVLALPAGGPLVADGKATPMSEQAVRRQVVKPICEALRALHEVRVHHRALRPDNLFFADAERSRVVLGDCALGAPGQCQPAAFEPIELAPAPPLGRGDGGAEADLYALGATVLSLLLGRVPGADAPAKELMEARMERGSYAALLGEQRFSPEMERLLSGLLADSVSARWGIADVDQWITGGRVIGAKTYRTEYAVKRFAFGDRQFRTPRSVADAFNRNWDGAAPEIRSARLETWLGGGHQFQQLAGVVAVLREGRGSGRSSRHIDADELTARVCIALDPDGPLRYKGTAVAVDGIAALLAGAFLEGRDDIVHALGAMIATGLPAMWIGARVDRRRLAGEKIGYYRRLRRCMAETGLGYGIERCLYDLNPSLRCLTTLVAPASCDSLPSLLSGLDAARVASPGGDAWIDRHIAGYIAARVDPDADRRLASMTLPSASEPWQAVTGLALLAIAQDAAGAPALLNLAGAIRPSISRMVTDLHSRTRRERTLAALERRLGKGDLVAAADLIADPELWREDERGYQAAAAAYARAEAEIASLQAGRARRAARAMAVGRRFAARVACVGLALTVLAVMWGYSA